MRPSWLIVAAAAGLVAGCGQSASDNTAASKAAASAAAAKTKPAFCFFKDDELKSWAATRDKDGNVALKGQAHVKDSRYKAVLGAPEIDGATATIAPTIVLNDTGFAAIDNWWDIKSTLPNSAAITKVTINCGPKTISELAVAAKP